MALGDIRARLQSSLGRLLCRLGIHDYRVIEETFGFGLGGNVKKLECRRCGVHATTRA